MFMGTIARKLKLIDCIVGVAKVCAVGENLLTDNCSMLRLGGRKEG